ncbi:uncharacterized protein LOC124459625 [Xenia sp. Carnegie-2017]|uniref:uncharacterized protein LOC124459625 n=1 Tax=Xenia sp. Carnegie-2017 TaxID=2897299 RepID=UPI001F03FDE6|nr:uncharacterized protein LOC124459625 [Xenia sp. Carnegie-2017]
MATTKRLNLKLVSKILVVFNPFEWKTASAREFLRIVDTQAVRASNPKCLIQSEISKKVEPKIEIHFADKDSLVFETSKVKVREILSQFMKKNTEKENIIST